MGVSTTHAVALVSRLAAGQWGLLTTAQAEREGVTRLQLARLADAGVLERVDRGVYATASGSTEHRALRAAWLTLDPARTAEERLADPVAAGVASHTSAAALHRLGDLLDDKPEFTLPERKQTRRGMRLHRGALDERAVTLVDGLPTTTEERTVADLLRDGHDPEHVAQIIGQGARRGVIDLDDLAGELERLASRYRQTDGPALVEYLLDMGGLSSAVLARELADSPLGKELVAAGAAEALNGLAAALRPQLEAMRAADTTKMLANLSAALGPRLAAMQVAETSKMLTNLASLIDVGKFIDLDRLGALTNITRALEPLQAQLKAAPSPFSAAAQQWLASDDTRRAVRALTAVADRASTDDEDDQ